MGWVNAPNTYQCAVQFANYDIFYQNSVYFEYNDGDVTRAHAKTVVAAIKDWYTGAVLPVLAADHQLYGVAVINLTTELGFTEFELYDPPIGGSAGEGMPFNLTYQIWFETGEIGRSGLGWNAVSGIPRDKVVGPLVVEFFATGLRDAYEALLSVAASVNCTWVVCSRHTGGVDRPVAVNYPVIDVTYKGLDLSTWRQRQQFRHT